MGVRDGMRGGDRDVTKDLRVHSRGKCEEKRNT